MNKRLFLRVILVVSVLIFGLSSQISAQNDPDTDSDGIPDSQDRCPQVFWQGTGCPDSDGDGLDDGADQCPFDAQSTPNGCQPDADGDGVPDVNDQCPSSPGSSQNNGCPQPAAQPTNTPVPQLQLPTTGVCVITPAEQAVNVRADRSTEAAVVTQLIPGQLYFPTALIDGWYGVPDPGGWVRSDVVRVGGDCSTLTTSDTTAPLIPTTDFSPDFANCGDAALQVSRVPVSSLMRFLNGGDPCGGLTHYLRERAFNPPPPPAPGAQALSAQARCSTDSSTYPTAEALSYLERLNSVDAELAANLQAHVLAALGSEPGSPGDQLICALNHGDGFVVGALIRRSTNELGALWTVMCIPPVEASVAAGVYNADGFNPLPGTAESSGLEFIPAEAALIIGLTSPDVSLLTRTQAWCSLFAATLPPAPPTPEQQAALDWLRQCGILGDAEITELARALNAGGVDTDVVAFGVHVQFTWADLLEFVSGYNGCPRDGRNEFAAFIFSHSVPPRSGSPRRNPNLLPLIPDQIDPNLVLGLIRITRDPVPMSINITVFSDQCDRASWDGSPDHLPTNCVSYPAFEGGVDVSADGEQHPPEPGVPGVSVDLYEGSCGGGSVIQTLITDANGQVSFNLLPPSLEQRYCVLVDWANGGNAAALGDGRWSTISGSRIYYGFTGGYGGTISTAFGWYWHAADAVNQSTPFEPLPGLLPIGGNVDPTVTPDGGALPPAGSYVVNFNMIVFDDHCDASGWRGDFRSLPAGCATWAPATLRANGVVDEGEPGIPGVTLELLAGSCSTDAPPLGIVVSDGAGRIVSEVPILFDAGDYCFRVDAAAYGNAAALQPGMWSATGSQVILIPQTVDRDLTLTTTLGWWRTAGSGAPPMAMGAGDAGAGGGAGAGGMAPAFPVGRSICPPGSSCANIPPRIEPIPDVRDLFPEVDPAALETLAAALEQYGDRFGRTLGIGVFLGRPDSNTAWNLYLYDGGNVYDIGSPGGAGGGAGGGEEAPSVSPDGRFAAYISRDERGIGTLMVMNLDNGIFAPLFGDLPGARLISRPPLWSGDGRSLLIGLEDENGAPGVYELSLTDPNALPVLVLPNASDPAFTDDGELMAFVRDGNVFIRFNATGNEWQITQNPDGTVCDTPLFDAAGVNLYFNCAQGGASTMFVQGFDGLQSIIPEGGLTLIRSGLFADGVSVFFDGESLFFGTNEATHLIPLVQIDGLQVMGIRWAG